MHEIQKRFGRSALHAPALKALVIQCLSLVLVYASLLLLEQATGKQISLISAALFQGVISALISRLVRLASWWLYIQFFFPVALLCAYAVQLPSGVFLAAFIFFLGLYWSTFRTQVPYYPSTSSTWAVVADLLPKGRPIHFIDIGSGLGGLVINLAAQRPESSFAGIELAPLAWGISVLRVRIGRSLGRFIYGDYEQLNFSRFDVVFAYLSPAAMPALWQKAKREMRSGTLLLSYEFCIPEVAPQITVPVGSGGAALFGWYF